MSLCLLFLFSLLEHPRSTNLLNSTQSHPRSWGSSDARIENMTAIPMASPPALNHSSLSLFTIHKTKIKFVTLKSVDLINADLLSLSDDWRFSRTTMFSTIHPPTKLAKTISAAYSIGWKSVWDIKMNVARTRMSTDSHTPMFLLIFSFLVDDMFSHYIVCGSPAFLIDGY